MSDSPNAASYTGTGDAPAPPPARSIKGLRWVVVVLGILTLTFFYGLDNMVMAVVQRFNAINRLPWISITFLIRAASTNFFWGQFYSLFDVKWTYIACVALFKVGSAMCGAAPSMTAFLVGHTICGARGCGIYTGVIIMLSFLTTPKECPAYLGLTRLT
ncbi:hypothetical protein BJY00DRAFT_284742 [Aspergillus carlsbadensis]|nr:hypothetical protein BJY00DRAFT_284742 [Aspergillus carlsbadensis]